MVTDKPPEPHRPERRQPLGKPGCLLCAGTGWVDVPNQQNTVMPCACRPKLKT